MQEAVPFLKEIVQNNTSTWEKRNLFPHVDKPRAYRSRKGKLVQREGSVVSIETFVKEKSLHDPKQTKIIHIMEVQIGKEAKDGPEYYFHYACTFWDNPPGRIDITFTNRDVESNTRLPNNITFTKLSTKKQPEDVLGDVSQSQYYFDQNGVCGFQEVALFDKGEYGDRAKYMVFGEYIRREKRIAAAFPQIDVSHQKLNAVKTIENLMKNINSETPRSPLDCLAVEEI